MRYSKSSVFWIITMITLLIYFFFFKEDGWKKIKENENQLVMGKITRTYIPYKSISPRITYAYELEGKKMESSRNVEDVLYTPQRVVNKYFPVIVSSKDPDESAILITPDDFSFFGKKFPDSLQWVVEFVREK